MPTEVQISMTKMFRDAVRQSTTLELRRPQDWDAFHEIEVKARKLEKAELADFQNNRDQLVTAEKKRLIDQAGALKHDHPTPMGTDRFNPSDIARNAERNVKLAHESRLIRIREDEAQAYLDLADTIRAREGMQDRARQDFTRSTDRRTCQDRRGPTMD